MRALLLAGLRLASGSPVAATRVAGMSLLERAVFVARDAGVTEAVVVAERPLLPALREAARRADLGVELAWADPSTDRDTILRRLAGDDPVVVVRADVAHTRLVSPALRDAEPGELLVDERAGPIRGAESLRLATGPTWVGLATLRADGLAGLIDGLAADPARGDVTALDAEVAEGQLQTVPVTGLPWQAVRSAAELRTAERLLVESLARPADAWVSRRVNRPLSARLTRLLVDLPLLPNHVSVAVFVVGMAGCIAIASGGRYLLPLLGALLLQGAAVLAGVDGELARVRYQGSFLGAWLDTLGHDLTAIATVMAVTASLANRGHSSLWTWLGVAAAVANVVAIAVAYSHMISSGKASPDDFAAPVERAGPAPTLRRRVWGSVAQASGRDTQALAVLVGALLGLLQIAVVALFVGALLAGAEAVRRSLQLRREAEATHGSALTGSDQP
jgi:phosphatidylglycerophosphate synthase